MNTINILIQHGLNYKIVKKPFIETSVVYESIHSIVVLFDYAILSCINLKYFHSAKGNLSAGNINIRLQTVFEVLLKKPYTTCHLPLCILLYTISGCILNIKSFCSLLYYNPSFISFYRFFLDTSQFKI